MTQRAETRPSTEPKGSFSPSRSQAFHSHMLHIVKRVGDPASVRVTSSVSLDPQPGHGWWRFRDGVIAPGISA